jgi:hypothetical protein
MSRKSFGSKLQEKHIKQRLRICINKWRTFEARIPVQYDQTIGAYWYAPLKFLAWRKLNKTWIFLPVGFDLVAGVLPVPKGFESEDARDLKRKMLRRASDSVQYGNRSHRAYWSKTLPNLRQRSERKRLCRKLMQEYEFDFDLEPDGDGLWQQTTVTRFDSERGLLRKMSGWSRTPSS